MPERAPLDLSAILPQYGTLSTVLDQPGPDLTDDAPTGLKYASPVRLGDGPDSWSVCRTLACRRPVIHDVNGYYRELGVRHAATRRELREAYQALDGQTSARLTYVLRQLLDPLVREAYDNSPLGQPFLDDYVVDSVKRAAAREAQKRTAKTGEFTSDEQVLDEWGYVTVGDDDHSAPLDTVATTGQDQDQLAPTSPRWEYASYAWQTSGYLRNEAKLEGWQAALIRAAGERRLTESGVAIGMTQMDPATGAYMLDDVNGVQVVFFPEDAEPSDEIAGDVLDTLNALLDSPRYPN